MREPIEILDMEKINAGIADRTEDLKMGEKAVAQHHEHFSTDSFFDDFTKLDTSNHSEDETIDAIMDIVSEHNA